MHPPPVPGTAAAGRDHNAPVILVMGVSGSGKSTVSRQLAHALNLSFLECDDLHSPHNVARMAAGIALTDADRQGWLALIAREIECARLERRGLVVACSALKRAYRDLLRQAAADLCLVHLRGSDDLLRERATQRRGHYMPTSLLASQLATLEPPHADEHALCFDVAQSPESIVRTLAQTFAAVANAATHDTSPGPHMHHITKTILFTDSDGRARFRDEPVVLSEGSPQSMLSPLFASGGYQLRHSPVGFRSNFHCTGTPQWVFILQGQMEIGLQGGASRVFGPGAHFYADDVLPDGATFDATLHGHWSRQLGSDPLVTLFVRG